MKLFKIITNCVIAAALVVSIALNIFLMSGFSLVKEVPVESKVAASPEVPEAPVTTQDIVAEEETEAIPQIIVDTVNIINKTHIITTDVADSYVPEVEECCGVVIYQDNNVRVTYFQYEEKAYGPVLKFKIENLSSKTLNVLCTDVYINGEQVFVSGLTCENLLPDTEAIEEFVLTYKDGKQLSDINTVSFVIKLTSAKSYLDLYDTNRLTISF